MHNAMATETHEDTCSYTFALVNYCSSLVVVKCSDMEGQQQQETSSTDKPRTNSDSLIGEIRKSVRSQYLELHLQDSGKDEWLVN